MRGRRALRTAAGKANVADHADQPPAGHDRFVAPSPHLVEFGEESIIIADVAELARSLTVLLDRPVGRGSDNEVHGFRHQKVQPPGIAQMKIMPGRSRSDRRLDLRR